MGASGFCVFLICAAALHTTAEIFRGNYGKMGDKRFQGAMATSETSSVISCCETCHRVAGCSLVSYHAPSRQCELHGFEIGDDAKIQSEPGWNVYYDTKDDCDSSPCQNGGTCQDSIGTYSCTCQVWYEGNSCEIGRCLNGWSLGDAACYRVYPSPASWTQAQAYCRGFGAELVSIRSDSENNFVMNLLSDNSLQNSEVYLGAYDVDGTNNFVWADDGSDVNDGYTFWYTDEPNTLAERCMATWTIGLKWNDKDCNALLPSMCKKQL